MIGVGLVYWPQLEPLFREGLEAVSTLVLEPQAFWEKIRRPGSSVFDYRVNDDLLQRIAELPQQKLLHGVGAPVGGSVDDPLDYVTPFRYTAAVLKPAWVSEHLSFNRVAKRGHVEDVGFLLPPRQTEDGVTCAIRNIGQFTERIPLPFAFETGVNYLKPRADELPDGEFFGSIARGAPCGIVLDLHNLWANERNGRQPVREVLEHLPLEQVWEIHLAGGMQLGDYWLDAHSDAIPPAVLDLAREVIPRLPNLGAVVFEILPDHIDRIGIAGVGKQLGLIHELAQCAAESRVAPVRFLPRAVCGAGAPRASDVSSWEAALAALVRGQPVAQFSELAEDPGTRILAQLVEEFRRSQLARGMRYTLKLLLRSKGIDFVDALLSNFARATPPDLFVTGECDNFAHYLAAEVPEAAGTSVLAQVVAFEHALVRASAHGVVTELRWTFDPVKLFESLDGGAPMMTEAVEAFEMKISAAPL